MSPATGLILEISGPRALSRKPGSPIDNWDRKAQRSNIIIQSDSKGIFDVAIAKRSLHGRQSRKAGILDRDLGSSGRIVWYSKAPTWCSAMSEDIDHASASAILALQLQDVEDLKRLYAGQEQTDQVMALEAYQAELERGAATCRDHHVATMFGESPLPDEQLPESPPAPGTIPNFGMIEIPDLPDHQVTNNLNDIEQGDIQQESPQLVEPSQEGTLDETGDDQPWLPRRSSGARPTSNVRDTTNSNPIVRAGVCLLSVFRSRLWDRTSSVSVDSDVHNITETTQSTGLIGKGKLGGTPELTGPCIICGDELPQEGILRLSCGDVVAERSFATNAV
ncbi:MAG: hypothetical protein Q9178_005804 [Gyalolechia marmorata]